MSHCLGPPPLSVSFNEDTNTLTCRLLCGQQYDTALYKVPRVEASFRKQAGSDANWPVLTVWLIPFGQIKQQRGTESTSINCDKGEAIRLVPFHSVSSLGCRRYESLQWAQTISSSAGSRTGLRRKMQLRAVKGAIKRWNDVISYSAMRYVWIQGEGPVIQERQLSTPLGIMFLLQSRNSLPAKKRFFFLSY